MYARKSIRPGGVFSIEKNFDENYIFLPLDFTQELLNYGNRRTWLEVKTNPDADVESVKKRIVAKLGDDFKVLTNEEQHQDLYRLLKLEKLFATLAFASIALVGSINIFFSLMMLALDKKKDISVLFAMGANPKLVRKIFITEGAIIAVVGAFVGLLFGSFVCFIQEKFGLVSMGMENAIVTAYPVKMELTDFLTTSGFVIVFTFLTSFFPASLASRSYSIQNL
jgi:lipoprotein-releasing system permease protein